MRRRLRQASSFLVVTALATSIGPLTGLVACSVFDAEVPAAAPADAGRDELDARPAEGDALGPAARDASGDGDAACGQVLGPDFINGGWKLAGDATTTGNFTVVLTTATESQGGLAWHEVDFNPKKSFRATFTLLVTTTNVPPSDGVTFFFGKDAQPVVGGKGDMLGFCGGVNGGAVALVTTLTTTDGGAPTSSVGLKHNDLDGCAEDGISATTAPLAQSAAGTLSTAFEILYEDAKVTVRRDGTTVMDRQQLQYLPGQIKSIGFKAATGANSARHEIKDFELTSCP